MQVPMQDKQFMLIKAVVEMWQYVGLLANPKMLVRQELSWRKIRTEKMCMFVCTLIRL